MEYMKNLFKVSIKGFEPLTAGHSNEVERKQILKDKILDSINQDSGNLKDCLDKQLSLSVIFHLLKNTDQSKRYEKDLDNLLKILLDVLPEHMDNTSKPEGLGLIRDNNDYMIFEIHCRKDLVDDESQEGLDIEISEFYFLKILNS